MLTSVGDEGWDQTQTDTRGVLTRSQKWRNQSLLRPLGRHPMESMPLTDYYPVGNGITLTPDAQAAIDAVEAWIETENAKDDEDWVLNRQSGNVYGDCTAFDVELNANTPWVSGRGTVKSVSHAYIQDSHWTGTRKENGFTVYYGVAARITVRLSVTNVNTKVNTLAAIAASASAQLCSTNMSVESLGVESKAAPKQITGISLGVETYADTKRTVDEFFAHLDKTVREKPKHLKPVVIGIVLPSGSSSNLVDEYAPLAAKIFILRLIAGRMSNHTWNAKVLPMPIQKALKVTPPKHHRLLQAMYQEFGASDPERATIAAATARQALNGLFFNE